MSALLQQLAADDRVRGVRQILNHEPSWPRNGHLGNLLESTAWQRGFGLLAEHGLRFDLQLNPHQFAAAARLVAAHPQIPVVIDHLGTPTLADLRGETYWEGMRALADCAHTAIKLSMLPYVDPEWDANALVTESVLRVIDLFGFFASNYPVQRCLALRTSGRCPSICSGCSPITPCAPTVSPPVIDSCPQRAPPAVVELT